MCGGLVRPPQSLQFFAAIVTWAAQPRKAPIAAFLRYFDLLPTLKAIPEVLAHIDAQQGRIPFGVVSGSHRESVIRSLTTEDRLTCGGGSFGTSPRAKRLAKMLLSDLTGLLQDGKMGF